MTADAGIEADLRLAADAAAGDPAAQRRVNQLADPMIRYQTDRFCKRFCRDLRYHYRCSLAQPWGGAPGDALLCEWGNASYGWMLDELVRAPRLRRYRGDQGARLSAYLFSIANSRPFYERWKDWRFGRRERAPTCILELAPDAGRVFLALRQGDRPPLIAQALGRPEAEIDELAQRIVAELARRGRLHLLTPPRTASLDGDTDADKPGFEPAWPGADPAEETERARLRHCWEQLDPVQRYVLEAMLIERREANEVLEAVRALGLRLGGHSSEPDRQQLYYFRRKALAQLARLMQGEA